MVALRPECPRMLLPSTAVVSCSGRVVSYSQEESSASTSCGRQPAWLVAVSLLPVDGKHVRDVRTTEQEAGEQRNKRWAGDGALRRASVTREGYVVREERQS